MVRGIPPALVVAVVLSVFNRGAVLVELPERWWLLVVGTWFVELALAAAGLFELARGSQGPARRFAVGAAVIYAAGAAWTLVGEMALLALDDAGAANELLTWVYRASAAGFVAAAVLLAAAVGGWRRTPVAAALGVAAAIAGVLPYIADVVGGNSPLFDSLRKLVSLGGCAATLYMLAVCTRDRSPALADAPAAMRGLRLAAKAMWLKLAVGVAIFNLGLTFSAQLPDTGLVRWISLIGIAATVVGAAALLRVATSRLDGLPVLRVVLGAAGILWWARIELLHMWKRLIMGRVPAFAETAPESALWSVSGPLLAGAGIVTIGTALVAFADAQTNPRLSKQVMHRTIAYGAVVLFAFAMRERWVPRFPDEFHAMNTIVTLPALAALLLLAGMFSRVADQLAAGPQLPPARAVST